jgi:transposase InsO family protein
MVGLSRRSWENGSCQSLLKTLQQEQTDARFYHTMEGLEQHVAELIEQICNRVRLHSALGHLSPAEFEADRCREEPCQRGWLLH